MDWNWFFSSVAQSAAAIVGIFAAFMITKIINSQINFQSKKLRIEDLNNEILKLKTSISNRYFRWFIRQKLRIGLDKIGRNIRNGDEKKTPEAYYKEISFPIYIEREKVLRAIEKKINQSRPKPASTSPFGLSAFDYRTDISAVSDVSLQKELDIENEEINKLIAEAKHLARVIETFLGDIKTNPESSSLISFSILNILILFFVGVIYPLSFLPLEIGNHPTLSFAAFFEILFSLKGMILGAISLVFVSVMVIFLHINLGLKHSKDEIGKLELYTDITSYSEYFKIMIDNINKSKKSDEFSG